MIKKYVLCLTILCSLMGCYTLEDITVVESDAPFAIEKDGSFVSKQELITLSNGDKVKYNNAYENEFYLPPKFIDTSISDGVKYIKLKGK